MSHLTGVSLARSPYANLLLLCSRRDDIDEYDSLVVEVTLVLTKTPAECKLLQRLACMVVGVNGVPDPLST